MKNIFSADESQYRTRRLQNDSELPTTALKYLALLLFALFIFLPFHPVVTLSFQSTIDRPDIAAGQFTLVNYLQIFDRPELRASLLNSISYVLISIGITLPVALLSAYAFSRYSFIGDKHLFLAILVFRITPPVVLSMPIFQLFSSFDLINRASGIALAHCLFNIPITIWILESFLSAIPKEVDETAYLDGYSIPRFFYKILIPMMMPGIGVAAFFCFMFSWVEVVFARVLTITDGKPISMAINALFGFSTDFGLIMALTMVSLLPGLIMIWFVRHHIARGFTLGKSN
ncbi:MAG: glycerol transport system permease protein [Granulosicoccus sp.]|jgi:glycerol transport system permease protein